MKIETFTFPNIKFPITYFIGKNAYDNFKIIDISKPNDLWFHINNISSCHVIANISELEYEFLTKKQLLTIIKKGALLCKQNTSKVKGEKKIEIIYTQVKNLVKIPQEEGSVLTKNTKIYTLSE